MQPEVDVNAEEIARRIAALTDQQRGELFRLCEERKRKNKNGADVAVYETVDEDVAEALRDQDLVWLIGSTLAAVRHDVYAYWEKHDRPQARRAARSARSAWRAAASVTDRRPWRRPVSERVAND